MWKFVIDTDSEKMSSVSIYADKDKTKRIAAPLDAVGRFAQTVEVTFVGSRIPQATDSLQLVVAWDGVVDSTLKTSDGDEAARAYIAHAGAPLEGEADTWAFPVRFESAALEAALTKRSKVTLRGAVVVENAAAGTHVEYHFSVGASASIFAGAIADPQTAPVEFARIQRLSWADYQALDAIDPDVIYIVADAPDVDKLVETAIKNVGYPTLENLRSGVQTQSILGYDGNKQTGNAFYLDGERMSMTSGGNLIDFPAKPGTVALAEDLNEISLQGLFNGNGSGQIDVVNARIFRTAPTDTGEFSGWQLSDFEARIFAAKSDGSLMGVAASAADGASVRIFGAPLTLSEPGTAENHAVTLAQLSGRVPLLETVPADGSDNVDAYGYLGTMRDLGAFGDAVLVSKLSVFTRNNGNLANGTVSLWCRILKAVNGAWVVAAQSENSAKWSSYGLGAEIPFNMQTVPGVTPPSADEKIAIVFVNSANAAASTANGTLSFRTVSGKGGFATALGSDANTAESTVNWSPRIKLCFAPIAGAEPRATSASVTALEAKIAVLEAALNEISAIQNTQAGA